MAKKRMKRKPMKAVTKRKIAKSLKGHKVTKATREKIRRALKKRK